jgi:hypothetical protein
LLGEVESLDGIDFNQTLYLGVTVGADAEMTPRKKLGAVPAALVAEKLGNASSSNTGLSITPAKSIIFPFMANSLNS